MIKNKGFNNCVVWICVSHDIKHIVEKQLEYLNNHRLTFALYL